MKKIYEAPSFAIITIASEDIMTVSPMDMAGDNFGTDIGEIVIG